MRIQVACRRTAERELRTGHDDDAHWQLIHSGDYGVELLRGGGAWFTCWVSDQLRRRVTQRVKPQWPLVFDLIDDPSEERDLIEMRLDCAWVLAPIAQRLGALQQSAARYPNIKPGEDFTGYA